MALSMKKDSVLAEGSTTGDPEKDDENNNWYNSRNSKQVEAMEDKTQSSSFDMSLAGASTPLNNGNGFVNTSGTFLSPIKKLDNLHLGSNLDEEDYDDYEDNDEAYNLGNKTIMNESEGDEEYSETDDRPIDATEAPRYINLRKRQHIDTPSDMVITPEGRSGSNGRNKMSVCAGSTGSGNFKFSFSQSDSTPCPVQPRKKLKFKKILLDEQTPSQQAKDRKKKILDFSGSFKTSDPSGISKLNSYQEEFIGDELDDGEIATSSPNGANSTMFSSNPTNISTPISQSTPANSRAPSPSSTLEEYGESINGYMFVKAADETTYYNYKTPTNSVKASSKMKTLYNTNEFDSDKLHNGKYKIIGEMPVTSAGLMDESTADTHVGDKRLLDPYASPASFERYNPKSDYGLQIRRSYEDSKNLPLLKHFETTLKEPEMLLFINDNSSVNTFYNTIQLPDEKLIDLLKSERIKWHPDKWYAKFTNDDAIYSKDVIDSLSQVINNMIDNLS